MPLELDCPSCEQPLVAVNAAKQNSRIRPISSARLAATARLHDLVGPLGSTEGAATAPLPVIAI